MHRKFQQRSFWPLWTVLLGALLVGSASANPFMIVSESEYPAMRELASDGRWRVMKTDAINYMNNYSYNPTASLSARVDRVSGLAGSGALAYILDPDNASYYVAKIKAALDGWEGIYNDRVVNDYTTYIYGGSAFMHSVLALDVIRDELTTAELASIEYHMNNMAEFFYTTARPNWPPNAAAAFGSWATYRGD
ncbi:MAG: hypothetical protein GX621_13710, partial [Pirellulaceae bacterium]|nr:hypothetical protein [Pirellulaceae bacterium]